MEGLPQQCGFKDLHSSDLADRGRCYYDMHRDIWMLRYPEKSALDPDRGMPMLILFSRVTSDHDSYVHS